MKFLRLILFVFLLAACAPLAATGSNEQNAQPTLVEPASHQRVSNDIQPTATTAPADESQVVTDVVKNFGTKLQLVSLLFPTAADDIRAQYAGFVSPDLLEAWAADPSTAPGRVTSSPWPDHIEISSVERLSDTEYKVTGEVIELTSVEVSTGSGAAAKIEVQLVLQKNAEGKWLITEYIQK